MEGEKEIHMQPTGIWICSGWISTAILHLRYSFRDIHGEHMYNKRVIVRTNDERHAVYNFALNTTRRLDNVVVCLVVVGAFVTLLDIVVHKTK